MEIKPKVAIIIPCYKARDSINSVVENCLIYLDKIKENFKYKIIIIDDACPYKSCRKIEENIFIKLIHNKKNLGVGASTIKGIRYACIAEKFNDGNQSTYYTKQFGDESYIIGGST